MADPDRAVDRVPRRRRRRDPVPGIYGTVICASVLAAVPGDTVPDVVVGVLVAMLVYWAAERYAVVLGAQMRREPLDGRRVRALLSAGWPIVEASYTPLLVLVAAWLLGADTTRAVGVALLYTVVLLVTLGWLAGRRTGLTGLALAASTTFTGALGAVIVLLKLALH